MGTSRETWIVRKIQTTAIKGVISTKLMSTIKTNHKMHSNVKDIVMSTCNLEKRTA